MKCITKSLLLSTFALFAVLFGSCIITSENVSAVVDYSVTLDKDNLTLPYYICGNSTGIDCSDYSYLSVSFGSVSPGRYIRLYFEKVGSWYQTSDFYTNLPFVIVDISNLDSNSQVSILPISNYSGDVTYTFMSDYSSCPVCPTCPEIPDNPYDNKFDEIKQAILIIPATALVIYFFFCIYRMLLKGRE